jgi:hypothetical protein
MRGQTLNAVYRPHYAANDIRKFSTQSLALTVFPYQVPDDLPEADLQAQAFA